MAFISATTTTTTTNTHRSDEQQLFASWKRQCYMIVQHGEVELSLREQARQFFFAASLATDPARSNSNSHDQALAALIQELQEPLTGRRFLQPLTHLPSPPLSPPTQAAEAGVAYAVSANIIQARIAALNLLAGALEGSLQQSPQTPQSQTQPLPHTSQAPQLKSQTQRGLSMALVKLLETFLLAHCLPWTLTQEEKQSIMRMHKQNTNNNNATVLHDDDDDYDEIDTDTTPVRDVALTAISFMLQSNIHIISSMDSSSSLSSPPSSSATTTQDAREDILRLRLRLSRKAVENRCMMEDPDPLVGEDHGFDFDFDFDNDDDDDSENNDDGNDHDINNDSTHERKRTSDHGGVHLFNGLSLMPQSRRSACFDVIQTAGVKIKSDMMIRSGVSEPSSLSFTLREDVVAYGEFVASLLLGESDPRCLLQLLTIFHQFASIFSPRFEEDAVVPTPNKNNPLHFPWEAFFDVVAPYYPIQFTPPPVNVHRITRLQLRRALINVFASCRDASTISAVTQTLILDRMMSNNITSLATNDSDRLTLHDKKEILQDLVWLLLGNVENTPNPTTNNDNNAVAEKPPLINDDVLFEYSKVASCLDDESVRHVSQALQIIFHNASLELESAVARSLALSHPSSNSSTPHSLAKEVIELCQVLIGTIARDCETTSSLSSSTTTNAPLLWDVFVGNTVRTLSNRFRTRTATTTEPSFRSAVAYLACLASCGGPKTLRFVLKEGLSRLLDLQGFEDVDVITAVYGIGAFFAAIGKSVHCAEQRGICMYPHPAKEYRAKAIRVIDRIIVNSKDTHNHSLEQPHSRDAMIGVDVVSSSGSINSSILSLRIAAVRAMECVMLDSPAINFEADEVQVATRFVQMVLDPIIQMNDDIVSQKNTTTASSRATEDEPLLNEWILTCCKTIGCLLSRAISDNDEPQSKIECFMQCDRMKALFEDVVYSRLVHSVANHPSEGLHYARLALAAACAGRVSAAKRVIGDLLISLQEALKQHHAVTASSYAKTLNVIFLQAEPVAAKAWHSLDEPSVTAPDILQSLAFMGEEEEQVEVNRKNIDLYMGTSQINLPASDEMLAKERDGIELVYWMAVLLRPAYESPVFTIHQLKALLTVAANTLPPLTALDFRKLAVVLPLLSAALTCNVDETSSLLDDVHALEAMLLDLTEFTINPDNHFSSRTHASVCLQMLIARYSPVKSCVCLSKKLALNVVIPQLKEYLTSAAPRNRNPVHSTTARTENGPSLVDLLGVLSLLCAAAASCRGSTLSFATAVEMVHFLVDVATTGQGVLVLFEQGDTNTDTDTGSLSSSSTTCPFSFSVASFAHDEQQEKEPQRIEIILAVASCIGSVLSVPSLGNLQRHRFTTKVLTRFSSYKMSNNIDAATAGEPTPLLFRRVGVLATACHITCSVVDFPSMDPSHRKRIVNIVSSGLSSKEILSYMMKHPNDYCNTSDFKKLVLSAVLKLIAVAPLDIIASNVVVLVVGVMQYFASESRPTSDVAVKVLALQVLESISLLPQQRQQQNEANCIRNVDVDLDQVRPMVLSVLSFAMNNPSSLVRQAAVDVRNAWYTLGRT